MTVTATYLVDAAGLAFSDSNGTQTWVHALPIGSYKHPIYGTIDVTPDRAKSFADSVKNKVRGIDLSINYEHDNNKSAAGWVKDAEARSDGVWLSVDFVPDAAADVRNKKWRYFSAEFLDEWEDSQGKKHKDILFGGALTNRPFMKNLVPINLSEKTVDNAFELVSLVTGKDVESLKGGNNMGLSDEDLDKLVAKLAEKLIQKPTDPKLQDPPLPKLSDIPELKQLAEENPMVKALIQHMENQTESIQQHAQRLKEAEISAKLAEFDRSKIVMTPVARQHVVNILDKMPTELHEDFWGLLKETRNSSAFLVELGERAGATVNYGSPKSAVQQFQEATTKLMSDDKIPYADAVERVASENPNLYKRYRAEQYEGVNR